MPGSFRLKISFFIGRNAKVAPSEKEYFSSKLKIDEFPLRKTMTSQIAALAF